MQLISLNKKLTISTIFVLGISATGLAITYLTTNSSIKSLILIFIGILFISSTLYFLIYKYLTNPLYKETREMKALLLGQVYKKIYTERLDEIGVIGNFFNEITASLEKATTEIKERRRLANELNIAAQIQNDLLPKESPKIPALEIITKTRPAAEIGGDSFDYIQQQEHSIIYLGDVTGHGIPSGLVMMMVNTLIRSFANLNKTPKEIIIQTNKELKPRIKKAMFMTMMLLKWDHLKKEMSYCGAGHEYILVYRKEKNDVEKIKSGGIALGMLPDNSKLTEERIIDFKENDFMILYSDGVTEGRNLSGEEFGTERLIETIKKAPKDNAEQMHSYIANEFTKFSEGKEQADDISLMVIHRKP